MRVVTAFFGLCARDALTSHVPACSHSFKRLTRGATLATSSICNTFRYSSVSLNVRHEHPCKVQQRRIGPA
jgi:hypothetical protein